MRVDQWVALWEDDEQLTGCDSSNRFTQAADEESVRLAW
jgi:hypothetical protein